MTKGPLTIELDDLPEIEADLPSTEGANDLPMTAAQVGLARFGARRRSRLWRWAAGAFVGLIGLAAGIWAWDFVFSLIDRSPLLGGVAAVLVGVVAIAVLVIVLTELAALARLGRIDGLRHQAVEARASGELNAARAMVDRLLAFYRGRGDAAWGASKLAEYRVETVDAADLLDAAERDLLAPLDAQALAEIERAAARVATITALVPLALADVAAALVTGITMIRRIAAIYGGRTGTVGAWRLTRAVLAHLAATGAMAVGDDLIGSALGGSVLSKLSRRFGEGLINGALTARLGVAAMELTRPVPFHATPRPSVAALVRRALTGLFTGGRKTPEAEISQGQ
jgi:putative membrane protein